MSMKSLRPDATVRQELSALHEDDVVETINLGPPETGIQGTIFISGAVPKLSPRVKYMLQPGGDEPSFSVSISAHPEVIANSLPEPEFHAAAPQAVKWVQLNERALRRFWRKGNYWTLDKIMTFVAGLQRLPDRADA
jgi:hypothetical protein